MALGATRVPLGQGRVETCRRLALVQQVSACFSYRYHIHGIPWYHGRGRREVVTVNLPLEEGGMVAEIGSVHRR